MATMIKLRLPPSLHDFASVQKLPGLAGLSLDVRFGLVPIKPDEGLFVVRAASVPDLDRRKKLSPEILGSYGDTRIGTTDKEP
jgi:hypothetical protein